MDPSQLFQQALARHRAGALEDAERLYGEVLSVQPDHVQALCNRGAALRDLERPAQALASYDRALALQPDHVWSLNNRGVALIDLKRPADALASFDRALALKPDYAEALNNRGKALMSLDPAPDPDLALASYQRAISLKPDYAEAYDNKGMLLIELGRITEAAEAIERAVSLAPGRARFYYHLAETRRMQGADPQLSAMLAMARDMTTLGPDEQIDLHFALAKALADAGDHARSFEHLAQGNALKRAHVAYDEAATLRTFERTRKAFTRKLMAKAKRAGDPSAAPVFIVGMPRSGTTLVEQVLAGHPEVSAMGETNAFADAMAAEGVDFPGGVPKMAAEALRRLGARYLDRIRAAAPDASRITNKRPDNFRFAGLIHLALPGAHIIHVRRDARDTCVSCFSKLFGVEVGYSFDLAELGRYHRAYQALMAHWRVVLPEGVMLEVDYEALVADLEGQSRRILAHCGVDWDPRCLDFHMSERRVRTASAAQVRRPIYTSSIGRWRIYEPFLGPLFDALDG